MMRVVNFVVARRLHFETVSREIARTDEKSSHVASGLRRLSEKVSANIAIWVMSFGLNGFLTLYGHVRAQMIVLTYFLVTSASAYLLLEPPTPAVCTQNRLKRSILQQMESDFLMMSVGWSMLLFVTVLNALHPGALSGSDKEIFGSVSVIVALVTLGVGTLLIRRGLPRQLRKLGVETSP